MAQQPASNGPSAAIPALPRRRRRLLKIILGVLFFFLLALIYAAWPGSSTFTVSPETTYVTGPLDKHGYVDYVTALNERLRKGITPESNANVLIWQVLGPHPEGGTMPADYFKWLGIESPPEDENYFVRSMHDANDDPYTRAEKRREFYEHLGLVAHVPWTAKDEPEIANWLKTNEKHLTVLKQATQRPNYYNPLVPSDRSGLLNALLPAVQRCRELAQALRCRAMLRLGEGKVDEAWQDLLACHRLGRLLIRGGCMIEMLVGIAIDQIACRADVDFLAHAKLPSKQLMALWLDLKDLAPVPSVADTLDLFDRMVLLEIVLQVARHGSPFLEGIGGPKIPQTPANSFTAKLFTRNVNWDPGLREVNRWIDRSVTAIRAPDRSQRGREMDQFTNDIRRLKQDVTDAGSIEKLLLGPKGRGQYIGNTIVALIFPAFDRIQNAAERIEQTHRNLHLAFALAVYKSDFGRYPAKLDELAPKYLEKIPDDLFSGKPLIYRLEGKGYLLYSVGPNELDEEGRGNDDTPRGDDISVRMPVPEPVNRK